MQPSSDTTTTSHSSSVVDPLEKKDVKAQGPDQVSSVGEPNTEKVAEDLNPAAPAGPNPADFPDGGFKAWSVVLGGWCCLFSSFGWINCIGVFQDYYQRNQLRTYPPSTVTWISSTQKFMMFVGAPLLGKIFDNYGTRFLLLFGTFFLVFGLMITSLATQY